MENGQHPRNEDIIGLPKRHKSVKWTEEEHQLFLMGLNKFGKGDWKNISRYYVITKTPTQVASHAQKFYGRQMSSTPPNRRRPSIHDIQNVNSKNFASGSTPHRTPNITALMATNNVLRNDPPIPSFTSSASQIPILNMNFHGAAARDPNPTFRSIFSSNYQSASVASPSAAPFWFPFYGKNKPWG